MSNPIIPIPGEDLLALGTRCNAVYICPKVGGVRTGKLVVYAGKDLGGNNLVGDIYFNFARIEPHPRVVFAYAEAACARLEGLGHIDMFDTICGLPEGGRTFGQALALVASKRFVYATKVPKPTEPGKKQEYSWDLSRFEFEPGERVALAEDVFNNFQNTGGTLEEVARTGVKVVLLVGALNRSPHYDMVYVPKSGPFAGAEFPVVASVREAYPEYEQSDPAVADDVARGNVEFEVKKHWADLMASMGR